MKVERINENTAKYTFEVTPEEFEHGLAHAFELIKDEVQIKGFRKGHVTQNNMNLNLVTKAYTKMP